MRYISDDGKVLNTEQECCEHGQKFEKEQARKKQLEMERKDRLEIINQKYNELQKLILEYEEDFCVKQRPYVAPFYEILDMLCG